MRRFGLFVVGVLATARCGGDGGGGGPPTITAVVVSGDSTVVLNGTRQLTATAMAGATPIATGITFQWQSSNGTTASVSSTGLVGGAQLGSVNITAQAVQNGTPTGVISPAKAVRVRIGSIALTSAALQFPSLNDTVVVTAQARDALNAAVGGVTFTFLSRTPGVATATPVTGSTTQANVIAVTNGTARIVATGDGVSDSVTATVQQVATALNVAPDTVTFGRIDSVLNPTVTATDARGNAISAAAISWNSLNAAVATVNPTTGAITSKNEPSTRVIAASGTLRDTVRVGVTLVYGSVQITEGGIPAAIDSALITRLNGSFQAGAIVRDLGNTVVPNPVVTWLLKNNAIATINGNGLVSGNLLTGRDSIILVARTVRDTIPLIVRQDVATVDVTPNAPEDLNYTGDTHDLDAAAFDGGGAPIPGKTFVWSASDPIVLLVNANGITTVGARTGATGVLVRVRAETDGVRDSVTIRVKQVPRFGSLDPNSFPTLTALGQQVTAICVVRDSGTDTIPAHPCSWTADPDSGVVSFSPANGRTTTITARKNGDAPIKAGFFPGLFAQSVVSVSQEAVRVKLHPTTLDTSRIEATTGTMTVIDSVFDANDSLITTPAPAVTWSAVGNAAVTQSGVVTAGAAGNASIIADIGVDADTVLVVVGPAVTLSGSVQPLLTTNCAGCHNGVGAVLPGVMSLASANATRSSTVAVPAIQSALRRILASRPDSSYLVHKVAGTHLLPPSSGSGERMPFGGPFLTRGQINLIRNWILQGALSN